MPTLVIYQALVKEGVEAGIQALEMAYKEGVNMAYGTGLLGLVLRR